jgi:hypothetical protein
MNYDRDKNHQRGSSAVFESKDRTSASYTGINRRDLHRRSLADRRGEMRFQADRREGEGRRADDKTLKFY